MDEWRDLDARLERKKRVKLRRQQRELKRQQKDSELLERERQRQSRRCEEMAREDALSVAMIRFYERREQLVRQEAQRAKDTEAYAATDKLRRRAKQLGLPLSTPGMSGVGRLNELQRRIETKESALETAQHAKQRLEAFPKKRNRVRRLLESYFASSVDKKLERAVSERRCEAIVELLDPKTTGKRATSDRVNHESENGLTPVLSMIFAGKLALLRRVLELGASPDFETADGITPLLACVLVDNVVALHILAEFHVNLLHETQGHVKALLLAADKGRNSILKALLRFGVGVNDQNANGRTALIQAVISRQYDTARILLAFNADKSLNDKSGRSALDWARHLQFDHISSLVSTETSSQTLMALIQDHEEQMADAPNKFLQEAINQQSKAPGTVAMEEALRDADVSRILELLSINDVGYGPNFETSTGEMPLLIVSKFGTFDDLVFCLQRKCGVSHCNREGINALMAIAFHGNARMMELVTKAGCSVMTRDFRGKDSLWYLHNSEQFETIRRFTTQPQVPPKLTLTQPVEDLRELLEMLSIAPSLTVTIGNAPAQRDDIPCNCSDDTKEHSSGWNDERENEDKLERDKSQTWSIRRRVLRRDAKHNVLFEEERQKIWRYAQRGRRNSFIAPLPFNPKGRQKFPPCDNCHASRARKRCFLCDQVMCDKCHARIHELPQRRHHEYEELEPILRTGSQTVDEIAQNQQESLKASIDRSRMCVQAIKGTFETISLHLRQDKNDIETDKYERRQRTIREKQIAQMQVNVPVAVAKHAFLAGDGDIYTNPAEVELADLYITQGKLSKARALMEATKHVVVESLGELHPTMLKVQIRLARVDQHGGDFEKSITTISRALACFESLLGAEQKDLVLMQDLALEVLDALVHYQAAVDVCQRLLRLRTIGLTTSHPLTRQAQRRMDEFIAKRERKLMKQEDELVLTQAANSAEQSELRRVEQERRHSRFRQLLLNQDPASDYDAFISYAKKEFADDMVHFWIAVEKAKTTIDESEAKSFRSAVVPIFLLFIKSRRIKIITAVQRKKMKKLITTPGKRVPRTIFDEVQALVFEVIYSRVFTRFESLSSG